MCASCSWVAAFVSWCLCQWCAGVPSFCDSALSHIDEYCDKAAQRHPFSVPSLWFLGKRDRSFLLSYNASAAGVLTLLSPVSGWEGTPVQLMRNSISNLFSLLHPLIGRNSQLPCCWFLFSVLLTLITHWAKLVALLWSSFCMRRRHNKQSVYHALTTQELKVAHYYCLVELSRVDPVSAAQCCWERGKRGWWLEYKSPLLIFDLMVGLMWGVNSEPFYTLLFWSLFPCGDLSAGRSPAL